MTLIAGQVLQGTVPDFTYKILAVHEYGQYSVEMPNGQTKNLHISTLSKMVKMPDCHDTNTPKR